MSIETDLDRRLGAFGAKWSVVPSSSLGELKEEIDTLLGAGKINPGIHGEHLSTFVYEAPADFGKDSSVVVIAAPQCISIATFRIPGRNLKLLISAKAA